MKKLLIPLIAALVAGNSYAILIEPISALRSISISGAAGDESYSETRSSSGLGVFDQSINGFADTGVLHSRSRASQTSSITDSEIALAMFVRAEAFSDILDIPPGPLFSQASLLFDLSFQVLEPINFELGGLFDRLASPSNSWALDWSLSNTIGTILRGGYLGGAGTLLPDTYRFRLVTNMGAGPDPFGDLNSLQTNTRLAFTSVPEAGSTLLLLGGAFGIILIGRKTFLDASDSL